MEFKFQVRDQRSFLAGLLVNVLDLQIWLLLEQVRALGASGGGLDDPEGRRVIAEASVDRVIKRFGEDTESRNDMELMRAQLIDLAVARMSAPPPPTPHLRLVK